MASRTGEIDPGSVFLNVPYDAPYERLFLALISCAAAAGLRPRCALELPERGQGQLARIIAVMQRCELSIHDLSRSRGNMPLELGYWMGLNHKQNTTERAIIVLCARLKPFHESFSDLRGLRPIVHANGHLKLISQLADNLDGLEPGDAERIYRRLHAVLPALKRKFRTKTCFTRNVFEELRAGARQLA